MGALTSRKWTPVLTADVLLDGERSVDTGTLTLPISANIDQGDWISYVQDVADTNYLYGIWNFDDSFMDEGGYDLDGTSVNDSSSRFVAGWDGRLGYWSGVTNDQVTISDATIPNPVMNFSGAFEWDLWIKPSYSSGAVTFISKATTTTGFEIGKTAGTPAYITMDMWVSSAHTNITGTHVDLSDGNEHYLRILRDNTNLVSLYVDGTLEGTATVTGSLTNTGTTLIFGSNNAVSAGTKNYTGYMAQVRMYCGGTLSSSDALAVKNSRRQPMTMKFAGIVQQVNDQTSDKQVIAQGFGALYNLITVNPNISNPIFTGFTCDYIMNGGSNSLLQVYLQHAPFNFTFVDNNSAITLPQYTTNGTLLNNIIAFIIMNNSTFYTNARQLIHFEETNLDHTDIIYKYTKNVITDSGTDNTALVNDLTVLINSNPSTTNTFSGNNTVGQTFQLSQIPTSVTVVVGSSTMVQGTNYSVNFGTGLITTLTAFATGTNNVTVTFNYVNPNGTLYHVSDSTSQALNGIFSKTITLNGLVAVQTPAQDFATNYLAKYKNVNRRVTINSPILQNSIRTNYQVTVLNPITGLSQVVSGNTVGVPLTIRSIEFKYPEATTTILVGEYIFNSYDLQNQTQTTVKNLLNQIPTQ